LKLVLACSRYVSVVAAVSAAMVCANAGGTPAATVKTRDRGLRFFRREPAEREREDSAAKSIRRTKMRRVVPCRVTAAQQLATNTQRTRPPQRENSHRRISRHCVPNLLFSQIRQRAGFCSTAPARIVLFVSQAWNGTGTR